MDVSSSQIEANLIWQAPFENSFQSTFVIQLEIDQNDRLQEITRRVHWEYCSVFRAE